MLADTFLTVGDLLLILLLLALIGGAVYLAGRIFGRGFKDSGED